MDGQFVLQRRPVEPGSQPRLTLGCPILDACLQGGIPTGSITELVGESTAGKTQLSMQLLLTVQWPRQLGGLEGSALYIYTEGEPPIQRLVEMAGQMCRQAGMDPQGMCDSIYVEKGMFGPDELIECLDRAETLLRHPRGRPVRLIVLDSAAIVFRDMGDEVGFADRSGVLFRTSALLRRLADEHGLAVVVVNQVADAVQDAAAVMMTRHTAGLRLQSSGRDVIPSLGLAWANCVNHRIFLSRATPQGYGGDMGPEEEGGVAVGGGGGVVVLRRMQVVFSPHLPQSWCGYLVTGGGVRGIAPGQEGEVLAV